MAGLLGGLIAPIMGPVVSGLLGGLAAPQPAPAPAAASAPAATAPQQDPNDQGQEQAQGGINLGGQNLARNPYGQNNSLEKHIADQLGLYQNLNFGGKGGSMQQPKMSAKGGKR